MFRCIFGQMLQHHYTFLNKIKSIITIIYHIILKSNYCKKNIEK
jgi:hypothetical protein